MQTLQHMPRKKQLKISRETLEVFAPLADRLNMGRVRVQLEELSFKFLLPDEFEKTKRLMDSRIKKSQRKLDKVKKNLSNHLTNEKFDFEIDGRVKSVYSLYKKLDRVGDIDKVYDLIALRIIVDDISSCYLVLSEIHQMYQPMFERIKDYINNPKPNGYQSLHTTVIGPSGQPVEFQIRTREMHEYAERGLAASFHYNEQKMTDAYRNKTIAKMPADLNWISELQESAIKLKAGKQVNLDQLRVNLFSDRIFVYSPKGDIYDLPKGAFPLDFAYRIHSDLASKASGFKVNGVMKPFSHILQSGDEVEILTNKNAKPKQSWRELMITPHAKEKLRQQLARENSLLSQLRGSVSSFLKR
ncbi:hypothetical protein CR956_01045 [Candidatus Saccharibacteria bacterium]|nr:MAG: hypothetical protein CR956_01045 [Candidatus Saccharibacteria bacterium]